MSTIENIYAQIIGIGTKIKEHLYMKKKWGVVLMKRGRPKLNDADRRGTRVSVLLTTNEYAMLNSLAETQQTTKSDILRQAITTRLMNAISHGAEEDHDG